MRGKKAQGFSAHKVSLSTRWETANFFKVPPRKAKERPWVVFHLVRPSPCTRRFVGYAAAILGIFMLPLTAIAAITYTRTPSATPFITAPFTITVSAESFSDYGLTPGVDLYYITLDDDYNPRTQCFPVSQLEASGTFDVPVGDVVKGVMIVGFTGFCETGDEPYYLEGTGEEVVFTIVAASGADTPSAGGGTPAYRPDVTILSPKGQKYFSSEIPIEYRATDKNDASSAVGGHPFGLSSAPVSIFFSDQILEWNHTIVDAADKFFIADKLPAEGAYTWRIADSAAPPQGALAPGNFYRIIVDAIDKVGELGEDVSGFFTIDPVPPTFIVNVDPSFAKSGKVTITVNSSEELEEPPRLTVAQRGSKGVVIPMEGEESTFRGVYEVLPGYDGTASIAVFGRDRAGNLGMKIVSGGSFNVGVAPPPSPVIISPANNDIASRDEITITGTSREDTEIIISLNGISLTTAKPGADGVFTIDKIKLDKMLPHGENILSIAARDQAGATSEVVTLRASLNARPRVLLEKPPENSALSGTSTLLAAKVSDENSDPVLLRYEALPLAAPDSEDGDKPAWLLLGETLSGKLLFDTTELADGKYLLRAVANDGATTTTSETRSVTVKNQLPVIRFYDGKRTVVKEHSATVRGSVLAPDIPGKRPTIAEIAYSRDRGLSWIALPAADGAYNSFEERFAATFAFQAPAEGSHDMLWRATDSRGFTVTTRHPVLVDSMAPAQPSIIFPPNNSLVSQSLDEDRKKAGLQMTISGRAEPRSLVKLTLAGGQITDRSYGAEASFDDGSWRKTIEIPVRGTYTIEAIAVDAAGNSSVKTTTRATYNTPPQIVFVSPREERGVHGVYDVRWLFKDPDGDPIKNLLLSYGRGKSAHVLVKNPKENSFIWDTTKLPTGNDYELKLEASDGFATSSETITIAIDNHPPTVDALTVPQRSFAGEGIFFATGESSDDLSGVEYVEYVIVRDGDKIPTKAWQKSAITKGALSKKAVFTITEPLKIPDGSYRLLVRAMDASGNISSQKDDAIVIDSTPPRLGSLSLLYLGVRPPSNSPVFPKDGRFTIPLRVPVTITLALEDDTADAALILGGGATRKLEREIASGLWKTEFSLEKSETIAAALATTDKSGNKGLLEGVATIVARPPGKIVHRDDSGSGALLPVPDHALNVLLLDPERNTYTAWGGDFSSRDDLASDAAGEYTLFLPRGTYKIVVTSPSFEQLTTDPFTLEEAEFITRDLVLSNKRSFWGIMKAWFKNIFD